MKCKDLQQGKIYIYKERNGNASEQRYLGTGICGGKIVYQFEDTSGIKSYISSQLVNHRMVDRAEWCDENSQPFVDDFLEGAAHVMANASQSDIRNSLTLLKNRPEMERCLYALTEYMESLLDDSAPEITNSNTT